MAESDNGDEKPAPKGSKDDQPDASAPPSGAKQGSSGEAPDGSDDEASDDDQPAAEHKGLMQRPILLVSGAILLIVAIVGGLLFWLHERNYESTDDAFIDAHIVRLAPQVAGRVTDVSVKDNEVVRPGQALIAIDSSELQTKVAQAEAQRAQAQAQVDNARVQIAVSQASYEQALAEIAVARAQAANAARDFQRYRDLARSSPAAVSRQQFDQAQAQAIQTAAQVESATRAAKAKADQIKAARSQVTSGIDQARAARAELDAANINAGYAHIVAPIGGHVTQKSVAVGNYVQAGTQLFAIVPFDMWITANFKETQLALMRPGQHVDIHVDACPKDHIGGHVDSIQRGAGQAFAILPAENATGNYVKVVQRVPVKILFDNPPKDCVLGPGMSVEPRVTVR